MAMHRHYIAIMSKFLLIIVGACVAGGLYVTSSKGPLTASSSTPIDSTKTDAASAEKDGMRNGGQEMVLKRAPNGHFYADVKINGKTLKMMVDTGASTIALSRDDAEDLGIPLSPSDFTGTAMTAAGKVGVKPITLERVAIGHMETDDVEAAVVEQGLDQSLLGQSWLSRVGQVTIEDDKMTLR
jgi:aspartyl protease family protein